MGVNVEVYLPSDVRVQDVADVMGILAGINPEKKTLREFDDHAWYVEVNGAEAKGNVNIPSMAEIILQGDLVDGEAYHTTSYHFECRKAGKRLVYPKSTPFWVAISKKLCKFFGGSVKYNDCDSGGVNASWPKPRKKNNPEDGKAWIDFEKAKFALKPVTVREIRASVKQSAYGMWPELDENLKKKEEANANAAN